MRTPALTRARSARSTFPFVGVFGNTDFKLGEATLNGLEPGDSEIAPDGADSEPLREPSHPDRSVPRRRRAGPDSRRSPASRRQPSPSAAPAPTTDPLRRMGAPARAPVASPSRIAATPFTSRCTTPSASWWGSSKVARSR